MCRQMEFDKYIWTLTEHTPRLADLAAHFCWLTGKRLWKQEVIKYELIVFNRNTKRQVLYGTKVTLPIFYTIVLWICNSSLLVNPSEMGLTSREGFAAMRRFANQCFFFFFKCHREDKCLYQFSANIHSKSRCLRPLCFDWTIFKIWQCIRFKRS